MTVSTTESVQYFVGNGFIMVFEVTYMVLDESHIEVYLDGVLQISGYTVELNQDQETTPGAAVTFDVAPEANVEITLLRMVDPTQETDYQPFDAFPAKSHETALDKLTMLVQQNTSNQVIAIHIPITDPAGLITELPNAEDRADRFIKFDSNGNVETSAGLDLEGIDEILVEPDSQTMLLVNDADPVAPAIGVKNINLATGLMKLTGVGEYPGLPAGGIPPAVYENTPAIMDAVQDILIGTDSLTMLLIDGTDPAVPILHANNINGEAGLMKLTAMGDYPDFPGLPGGGIPVEVLESTPYLIFAVYIDDGTLQPGTDSEEMLVAYRQSNPEDPFGFVDVIGVNTPNQPLHLLQLDQNGLIPADLLAYQGLRNLGIFRGDDLCPKPNDEVGECTAPDTRNPSQRWPSLDFPPGGTPTNQQFHAGDFFAITMADGEVSGTMLLFTEAGQAAPAVIPVDPNDGITFLEQLIDPDDGITVLIEHGWYYLPDRFNLTTAALVSLDTAGYGFIGPLPNDDVQNAFNFLDTALAGFRADQSSFDTSGGTLIIDPASSNVQLALLDLDTRALSKVTGGVVAGMLTVKYGQSPTMAVQIVDPGGFSSFQLRDAAGVARGMFYYSEATGQIDFRRADGAGAVQTTFILNDNGNVSINGAAPVSADDLTRKDYVDSADAGVRAYADQQDALLSTEIGNVLAHSDSEDDLLRIYSDEQDALLSGRIDDSGFPAGVRMLFVHTTAPPGWTKLLDQENKALRITSGGVTVGGTVGFTTVFGQTGTAAHAISEAEMPSHTHNYLKGANTGDSYWSGDGQLNGNVSTATTATGSGAAHSHSMDMRVQYVDVIYAEKN